MYTNNLFIAIATHKEFQLGKLDGYASVFAGAANNPSLNKYKFDYLDNQGDNISTLNKFLCEITVMYWLWKNTQSEFVGLVHYRRFFSYGKKSQRVEDDILKKDCILKIFEQYDLILPIKKNYFPFTVKKYYGLRHESNDIKQLNQIFFENCDEKYINAYKDVFSGYKLHLYNMFLTRREILHEYMTWLMPILVKLEERKIFLNKTDYQSRAIAFIAERLFNVWVCANVDQLKIKYLPVRGIGLEKESKKAIDVALQIVGIKEKK